MNTWKTLNFCYPFSERWKNILLQSKSVSFPFSVDYWEFYPNERQIVFGVIETNIYVGENMELVIYTH